MCLFLPQNSWFAQIAMGDLSSYSSHHATNCIWEGTKEKRRDQGHPQSKVNSNWLQQEEIFHNTYECILRQDSVCPLCQEEEDTTAHFIAQCSALMLLRKNILGDYLLSLDMLSNIHWFLFLKTAKASKRVYWPCGLSGLHIGPMLLSQCWVTDHAGIHPAR